MFFSPFTLRQLLFRAALLVILLAGPKTPIVSAQVSSLSQTPYIKQGVMIGTWVKPREPRCKTLKIYFPGQAQELGYRHSRVPENERAKWADILLNAPPYSLAQSIEKAGCPVILLGESQASLNAHDIQMLINEAQATQFELLAHSAGYNGLTTTLTNLKDQLIISKLSALKLLDNFYDQNKLPTVIESAIGSYRSRAICIGFFTDHNAERYKTAYETLCPSVQKRSSHKAAVRDFFE